MGSPFKVYLAHSRLYYDSRSAWNPEEDPSARVVEDVEYGELSADARSEMRMSMKLFGNDWETAELSDEEFDLELGFAVKRADSRGRERLVPTVAGVLFLGEEELQERLVPKPEVKLLVRRGDRNIVRESLCGPLFRVFVHVRFVLDEHNELESWYIADRVVHRSRFSEEAMMAALVNALTHRDYFKEGIIEVKNLDSGFRIKSPGGFPPGVVPERAWEAKPVPRNRTIAEAFRRFGFTKGTGEGIRQIFAKTVIDGTPLPDYSKSTSQSVALLIPRAKPRAAMIRWAEKQKRRRKKCAEEIIAVARSLENVKDDVRDDVEAYIDELLAEPPVVWSEDDQAILAEVIELMEKKGAVSRSEVAEAVGISPTAASYLLKKMVRDHLAERVGKGAATRYRLDL